jgi:hypothetical protein
MKTGNNALYHINCVNLENMMMKLDTIIYPIITTLAIIAACYGIDRLKGVWIIGALLYIVGGILSFMTAYLIFYPVFSSTHFVFIPGVIGFFFWSFLILQLFFQHILLSRRNSRKLKGDRYNDLCRQGY